MEDDKKDKKVIDCKEGYLIKKNKKYNIFVMNISENECGENMVINKKNIKKMVKLGRKKFYKKEFEYKKFKIGRTPRPKGAFTRMKLTPKERRVLNTAYSKEYKGLKGIELIKAMTLKDDKRGGNIIK